jgi:hypothetical protein
MSTSERNALAAAWLAESGGAPAPTSPAALSPAAACPPDDDSSNDGSRDSMENNARNEMIETWMIMEMA